MPEFPNSLEMFDNIRALSDALHSEDEFKFSNRAFENLLGISNPNDTVTKSDTFGYIWRETKLIMMRDSLGNDSFVAPGDHVG
jgi:hypothetical protein